mmetsp:Transcript_15740/g.29259  ORF Transcript_15740/g.29259 Transcript_15740/m.29259 type:complete len:254 (-) Transcript_15740:477-1238(-)
MASDALEVTASPALVVVLVCSGRSGCASGFAACPSSASPVPSASSSSHSTSYMLLGAAALLVSPWAPPLSPPSPAPLPSPWSFHLRASRSTSSQEMMRRQRFRAFNLYLPSSIVSSSRARSASCRMLATPFHPGVEGPAMAGTMLSTSIRTETGPVASGMPSIVLSAYAVYTARSISLTGTPSRKTSSKCMPSTTPPGGRSKQRPMQGGTNSVPSIGASSSPTMNSSGSFVLSSFMTKPSLPLARPIRVSFSP